ncbi:MAG: hypothetical protein JSS32_07635 [Verrucomicrobia bacterium]|nr:hypothetical protein [Verrucomicrobiota bacterium]
MELSNGMTLEVKWGFGRYQSGETLRLEFDGSYLNVYCAKGPVLRLAQVNDNYYISD